MLSKITALINSVPLAKDQTCKLILDGNINGHYVKVEIINTSIHDLVTYQSDHLIRVTNYNGPKGTPLGELEAKHINATFRVKTGSLNTSIRSKHAAAMFLIESINMSSPRVNIKELVTLLNSRTWYCSDQETTSQNLNVPIKITERDLGEVAIFNKLVNMELENLFTVITIENNEPFLHVHARNPNGQRDLKLDTLMYSASRILEENNRYHSPLANSMYGTMGALQNMDIFPPSFKEIKNSYEWLTIFCKTILEKFSSYLNALGCVAGTGQPGNAPEHIEICRASNIATRHQIIRALFNGFIHITSGRKDILTAYYNSKGKLKIKPNSSSLPGMHPYDIMQMIRSTNRYISSYTTDPLLYGETNELDKMYLLDYLYRIGDNQLNLFTGTILDRIQEKLHKIDL